MGDRKCAFEACNALEFRATGYCLRHKGGVPDEKNFNVSALQEKDSRQSIPQVGWNWTTLFLVWFFPPILGVIIPIMLLKWLSSNLQDIEEKDDGQSDNSDHTVYETSESGSPEISDDPWWVVDVNSSDDNRIF